MRHILKIGNYFDQRYPLERNKKLLPLESLRGVAALIVSLLHFQIAQSFLTSNSLVRHGDLMVDLFFVLSGFVIAYNYRDRISSLPELFDFQVKRFWRLYPLHLFTLLVFLAIELARFVVEMRYPNTILTPAFEKSTALAFLSNLSLTQAFTGHLNTFNGVSWSISTEFYTYLILGLVLLLRKYIVQVFSLIIIVSGVVLYLSSPLKPLDGPHSVLLLRCLFSFFIGVLCFEASIFLAPIPSSVVPWVSLCVMLLSIVGIGKTAFEIFIPVIFGVTIVLIVKAEVSTMIHKILSNGFTVWLGKISYSIYMVHGIVWAVLFAVMRFVFGSSSVVVDGVRYLNFSPMMSMLLTCISIAILLATAHLTYRFIEVPCNLSKRSKTRPKK